MKPHIIRRDSCPVCAQASPRVIFSRAYTDPELQRYLRCAFGIGIYGERHWLEKAAYTIHFCERCQLVSQRDVPDEFLIHRLWELRRLKDSANASCRQITQADSAKRSGALFLAAATAHLDVTSLRTLCFGFDSWEHPQTSTASCAPLERTTDSPQAREWSIFPRKQPTATIEPANDIFDVIHVGHALEHSSNPRSIVMSLARKLRAGGVLHMAARNGARIRRKLHRFERDLARSQGRILHTLMPLQELNCFCPETLVLLAGECGLEPLRPGWRSLIRACRADRSGPNTLLLTLVHLCYLRSRHSTDLSFRKLPTIDGENCHGAIT